MDSSLLAPTASVSTSIFQSFTANTEGRDFVCGDVHGQWAQLQQSLNDVGFNTKIDRLFILGDLVDRGAESREVFTLLEEPWFFSIRGNHEQLMFDALEKQLPQDVSMWFEQGARDWVRSTSALINEELSLIRLINQQRDIMPWAIELALKDGRKIGLVHAEVSIPQWDTFVAEIQTQKGAQLRYKSIWSRQIREAGYESGVNGIDLCVHGHCMFKEPVRQFNRCYIDTGAYLTKKKFFGIKKEALGCLTLIQAERLFDIPETTFEKIRNLSLYTHKR